MHHHIRMRYNWELGFCVLLSVKLPVKDPVRADSKSVTSTNEMIPHLAGFVGGNRLHFWGLPTRIFNFNRFLYGVYIMRISHTVVILLLQYGWHCVGNLIGFLLLHNMQ